MPRLPLFLFAAGLAGVVACASIVKLDASDEPHASDLTPGDDDHNPVGGEFASDGGVSVTPAAIVFPPAACGVDHTMQISVRNDSAASKSAEVSLGGDDAFSLAGADGDGKVHLDVPAHQTGVVNLKGKSTKPGTATTEIRVKVGGDTTQLNASLDTTGPGLAFDPPELDFGDVRQGTQSEALTVTIRNDGNDPITIKSFSPADNFKSPVDQTIGAGKSITTQFAMLAGLQGPALNVPLVPMFDGQLCGATPRLIVKGTRVNQDVTLSTKTLDFQSQGCSTSPSTATQQLNISNFATTGMAKYKLELKADSKFKIVGSLEGTVPVGGATPGTTPVTVGIVSTGTTLGDVSEDLQVTLTPAAGAALPVIPVKLKYKTVGAIIQTGDTNMTLRSFNADDTSITNVGNAEVCVRYASTNSKFFSEERHNFSPDDDGDDLVPNQRGNWRVEYRGGGGDTATISLTSIACKTGQPPTPICVPPPTIKVTGTN